MKFQITKTETNEVIATVEATSKAAALKSAFSTRKGKITVSRKADWIDNVYSAGYIGCDKWEREYYTVTEVVEVVEVVAEPTIETYVAGLVKTYTVAKLAEIITEHADAKVRAYQVLCAGAQAELATR
jgi:hypothetical protein